MQIKALTKEFYDDYGHYEEILQKKSRPYVFFAVEIEGVRYAIPLRHHIKHRYCFHTVGDAGIDYSKSVVLVRPEYAEKGEATIDTKEAEILRANEQEIIAEFARYIERYKRALRTRNHDRSEQILRYSTLQYFKEFLE